VFSESLLNVLETEIVIVSAQDLLNHFSSASHRLLKHTVSWFALPGDS